MAISDLNMTLIARTDQLIQTTAILVQFKSHRKQRSCLAWINDPQYCQQGQQNSNKVLVELRDANKQLREKSLGPGDTLMMLVSKKQMHVTWFLNKESFARKSMEEHQNVTLVPFMSLQAGLEVTYCS